VTDRGLHFVDTHLNIFKALSDENRLRVLLMLRQRPLCVCEMHEVLDIALSTLSAHLKLMKNTGLIVDEKDGRWVIYRLSQNRYLHEVLMSLEKELQLDPTIRNDRLVVSRITREICATKLKESARLK
jgi:ArsR family transcriptional regulator